MYNDFVSRGIDKGPRVFAVTGHRPDKVGGYSDELYNTLVNFAEKELLARRPMISEILSGFALGWDQAVAEASYRLGIPVVAAVPFEGQHLKWPEKSQHRYKDLLAQAKEVVIVSQGGYSSEKMLIRNLWMIERAESVLALWNGSRGGTSHAVNCAYSRGTTVVNLWTFWKSYSETR